MDTNKNKIAQKIYEYLKQHHLTISFCESASAGALTSMFCETAGVSEVFKGSIIAYQNEVKNKLLGISDVILNSQGAVSATTAELMATNTAKKLHTDICISITGNAGSNVMENKPACFYYVGIFMIDRCDVFEVQLVDHERNFNRFNIADYALNKLYEYMK